VAGILFAGGAGAEVFLSRQEALKQAFPHADEIRKRTVLLDDAQVAAIQSLARAPLDSRIVTLYTGIRQHRVLGYALVDIHTVRTQPEAFLVVLTPEGKVRSLFMLAFYEPPEYRPPRRWLRQFDARGLSRDLRIGGTIHGIAGATLSSRAVTGTVRRSLALFQVLVEPGLHQKTRRSKASAGPAQPAGGM